MSLSGSKWSFLLIFSVLITFHFHCHADQFPKPQSHYYMTAFEPNYCYTDAELAKAIDFSNELRKHDPVVDKNVAFILQATGISAYEASNALVDALRNPLDMRGYYERIEISLVRLGRAAVPDLIPALRDKNIKVRRYAITALADIGIDAKEALPFLIESLKDQTNSYEVMEAIKRIGVF